MRQSNPSKKYELYEVYVYKELEEDVEDYFRCLIMATSTGEAEAQMFDFIGNDLMRAIEESPNSPYRLKSFKITAKKHKVGSKIRKRGIGRLGYLERYEDDYSHRGDHSNADHHR